VQKKSKRRAFCSPHGAYLVEIGDDFEQKKTWWSCNLCDEAKKTLLYVADSTNAATKHLKAEHRLQEVVDAPNSDDGVPLAARDVLTMQREAARGAFVPRPTVELFRSLFLEWIVDQNISLAAVESLASEIS
jgi:hypothetical protein